MTNQKENHVSEYVLADSVWQRVVQIVQEAMLTGVDCADLLRQVRVQVDQNNELVLTPAYQQQVKENYEKMVKEAEIHRKTREATKIIGKG